MSVPVKSQASASPAMFTLLPAYITMPLSSKSGILTKKEAELVVGRDDAVFSENNAAIGFDKIEVISPECIAVGCNYLIMVAGKKQVVTVVAIPCIWLLLTGHNNSII